MEVLVLFAPLRTKGGSCLLRTLHMCSFSLLARSDHVIVAVTAVSGNDSHGRSLGTAHGIRRNLGVLQVRLSGSFLLVLPGPLSSPLPPAARHQPGFQGRVTTVRRLAGFTPHLCYTCDTEPF